jgi:hypothetical protein
MRRAEARREVSVRVRLSDAGGFRCEGWALNVSRGGVRVILEERLELGAELDVAVHDPIAEATTHRARVVWVQEEPDGVVAGLEFLS